MTDFLWDGPEDSDEEIAELVPFKNEFEHKLGVKFSKNGIIDFIENLIATESAHNKDDPRIAKLWEEKLNFMGIKMYIKKNGSQFCTG